MSGARKYGAHRVCLTTISTVAGGGTAATWAYDAFAENGGNAGAATTAPGYDPALEQIIEMALTLSANLTGQATNFTTFRVTHRNAAASTVDQISIVASTSATVFVAFIPANLAVGSGVVVPGTSAGTLTLVAGVALPWTLTPGDTITLDAPVTGTGQYAGGVGLNFVVQQKGA